MKVVVDVVGACPFRVGDGRQPRNRPFDDDGTDYSSNWKQTLRRTRRCCDVETTDVLNGGDDDDADAPNDLTNCCQSNVVKLNLWNHRRNRFYHLHRHLFSK